MTKSFVFFEIWGFCAVFSLNLFCFSPFQYGLRYRSGFCSLIFLSPHNKVFASLRACLVRSTHVFCFEYKEKQILYDRLSRGYINKHSVLHSPCSPYMRTFFVRTLLPICVPEPAVGSLSALVPFSCAAASRPSASFGNCVCYLIEALPLGLFLKQGGNLTNKLQGCTLPPKFQTTQGQ